MSPSRDFSATNWQLISEAGYDRAGCSPMWVSGASSAEAQAISRRKTIYETLHREAEAEVAGGEALGDDLEAVAGTSLDKGVELDA